MRRVIVWIHRWVGLTLAVILVIEGLTGGLLAYRADLTRCLEPAARPHPTSVPPLDLGTLGDRTNRLVAPRAQVAYFFAPVEGQVSIRLLPRVDPATGKPYPLEHDHLRLDAATGQALEPVTGRRDPAPAQARIMPFIYELHTVLALGDTGRWILGIAATLWTLDCLWAVLLTLPVSRRHFWRRWGRSWRFKWRAAASRVNFDAHRAGSLWTWLLLLMFAWSSVYLTLPSVYEPVMRAFFNYAGFEDFERGLPHRYREVPALDWRAAQRAGDRLIAELAAREHFSVLAPAGMAYFVNNDLYSYTVHTTRRFPEPADFGIYLDAEDGHLLRVEHFSGEHTGNTISNWLYALHLVRDPLDHAVYRLLVCLVGLVTTLIAVTGLVIWWQKRSARRWGARRRLIAEQAMPKHTRR